MGASVVVVRTGTANLASVLAALRRLGAEPLVTTDPAQVRQAERLLLPGVGAFGAGMQALRDQQLIEPIAAHVQRSRPLLAICLGLQMLCEWSDESPGVEGIGLVPGRITRFGEGVRVPQLGWNQVKAGPDARLLRDGYAYFANSYRLERIPNGWSGATSHHGGEFVAALERGNVLACQFHPELSGTFGRDLLERWLRAGQEGGAC